MPEPRTPEDKELLSAHPSYTAIQDGIAWLDGAGCMPESASAIRSLDAQNDARGREIDQLNAIVGRVERTREAMRQIIDLSTDPIQRAAWMNAESLLADAINCAGPFGAGEPEPVSSRWALRSEGDPPRLLDLITYDTGPVTEAQAREGLGRAVVPLTGTLEAIDETRPLELRALQLGERRDQLKTTTNEKEAGNGLG